MREKIEAAIAKVRPALQADGGDIALIDVDESTKTVKVKLSGACGSCPFAAMTLQQKVLGLIKEYAPEVEHLESV